jgi:hypothetical protein
MPEIKRAGTHWMVKSSRVQIQGRFRNRGYIDGIAVGGDILGAHELVVDVSKNKIQFKWNGEIVDDQAVLRTDDGREVRLQRVGHDSALVFLPEDDLHLKIKNNWGGGPRVTIEMQRQPSQDGLCGNANSDLSDETPEHILESFGAEIPRSESFFNQARRLQVGHGLPTPRDAGTCAQMQQQYEALCKEKLEDAAGPSLTEVLLGGCMADVCAFGEEQADNAALVAKDVVAILDRQAQTPAVIPQGVYTLKNINTGEYLNVLDGSTSKGANVQIWNERQSSHSQWTIRPVEGDVYTLENLNAELFLRVDGGHSGFWANVQIWDNPSSPESQWEIRQVTDGVYTLRAMCGDKYLNVEGGQGANVHMWDNWYSSHSQWTIEEVQAEKTR